jgi:hypothetical protein
VFEEGFERERKEGEERGSGKKRSLLAFVFSGDCWRLFCFVFIYALHWDWTRYQKG